MDSTGFPDPRDLDLSDSTIEVAFVEGSKEGSDRVVTMRDASNPDGPTLVFTPAEWEAFVAGVRDGEFDLDENGQLVELPERPADPQ
jgi:hypothetical protein